jgi:hypothetical protein
MKHLPLILLMVFAAPVPASAAWSCADATYASELCPWFGEGDEGFAAPIVEMRWSSDGYPPGSAAASVNDGIVAIVRLPRAAPSDGAILLDISYEPHWLPGQARSLTPEAVILRLGERLWRAEAQEPTLPLTSNHPTFPHSAAPSHHFAFGADTLAAMLSASDAAPRSYHALYGDDPSGVLHFEILFRGPDEGIVTSNDILQIDSGGCETHCQPRLSLAGFAAVYNQADGDADE